MNSQYPLHFLHNDKKAVFLGSVKNPHGRVYDIFATTHEGKGYACVHGNDDCEYGSGAFFNDYTIAQSLVDNVHKDYIFGIAIAKLMAIAYHNGK